MPVTVALNCWVCDARNVALVGLTAKRNVVCPVACIENTGKKPRNTKAANEEEAPLDARNERSVDFTRFAIRCAYRREIRTSSESVRRRC